MSASTRWSAAVLAVVCAACATDIHERRIMDRFFGLSSGWIRYVLADAQLRTAIQNFELVGRGAGGMRGRYADARRCPNAARRLRM